MTGSERTYDLSDVLAFDTAASVRPGTTLLVSGPPMTGKEDLLLGLVGAGVRRGEAGVVVTTDDDGEETLDRIVDSDTPGRQLLSAVDCRARGSREEFWDDDGALVYSVPDPSDFTGIGIGITRGLDRVKAQGVQSGRLALTSLSTMIRFADRKTTFKFCHVLSQRLDAAGFVGFFALNTGAHDDQTVEVIRQAFDAEVEIRNENGRRQARLVGLETSPTEWRSV